MVLKKRIFGKKRISPELEKNNGIKKYLYCKRRYETYESIYEDTNDDEYTAQIIAPIVMQGDPIGTVI